METLREALSARASGCSALRAGCCSPGIRVRRDLSLNASAVPDSRSCRSTTLWALSRPAHADQGVGRRERRLERANLSFASALVATLDARDRYTAGHSSAVAVYARDIAARMGLSAEEQQLVHVCGLVHDIGKIGLPAGLLEKPGALTLEERRDMQQHSEIGERILCKCRYVRRDCFCRASSPRTNRRRGISRSPPRRTPFRSSRASSRLQMRTTQ